MASPHRHFLFLVRVRESRSNRRDSVRWTGNRVGRAFERRFLEEAHYSHRHQDGCAREAPGHSLKQTVRNTGKDVSHSGRLSRNEQLKRSERLSRIAAQPSQAVYLPLWSNDVVYSLSVLPVMMWLLSRFAISAFMSRRNLSTSVIERSARHTIRWTTVSCMFAGSG